MNKWEQLKHCMEIRDIGYVCEFGVHRGTTIRLLAAKTLGAVFGFDSFEGLPEDWVREDFTMSKEKFKLDRNPDVPDNVVLVTGWFKDTIPKWSRDYPGNIGFMHIDCDIYSSTETVLSLLNDQIVEGTIIVFDELFNYPGWEKHEHKALTEWCEKYHRGYTFIHKTPYPQASIRIAA